MEEPATVKALVYQPRNHSSDLAVGFSGSGNLTFTPVDVNFPEKWAVVFKCQHGSFVIERRDLFERLDEGQDVVVIYDEIWTVYKEQPPRFRDYDFIDVAQSN